MTLEELKALWDAAVAKAAEAPEDADLKSKAEEAQAAYEAKLSENPKGDGGGSDDPKWDEKTKSYIAKLRTESASSRNKSKDLASKLKESEERTKAILKAAGIEDDSEKPEEKIKILSATTEQLTFDKAILESALQHGIPADRLKYYKFLVSEAASELKDGEELTEEKIAELVADAKKFGGSKSANTHVGQGSGSGKTPPPEGAGGSDSVTLDQFVRMSITEKSQLYLKNADLYTSLMKEAKAKKKLV